eukprot:1143831-Pelagomonas_calceolata.AAC.1
MVSIDSARKGVKRRQEEVKFMLAFAAVMGLGSQAVLRGWPRNTFHGAVVMVIKQCRSAMLGLGVICMLCRLRYKLIAFAGQEPGSIQERPISNPLALALALGNNQCAIREGLAVSAGTDSCAEGCAGGTVVAAVGSATVCVLGFDSRAGPDGAQLHALTQAHHCTPLQSSPTPPHGNSYPTRANVHALIQAQTCFYICLRPSGGVQLHALIHRHFCSFFNDHV